MQKVQIVIGERAADYSIEVIKDPNIESSTELPEETLARYARIRKEYDEMQAEIASLLIKRLREARAKRFGGRE